MVAQKKYYTVLDIETTGGLAKRDRITEIAIVRTDGETILDTYESLINPGRSIPSEITRITGITDEMVADAPYFFQVAKEIVQWTEDAIFVAHNVRFDYSFIQQAFAELGYTFSKKQLCTVRLARTVFPGLKSYSLGNLIKHFGIAVNARHRALDDALATTQILLKALQTTHGDGDARQLINGGIRSTKLPDKITMDLLHSLPESPGVYYFHNDTGKVVYVGKSINIRKRVMQHFSKVTSKSDRMLQVVRDITYEVTGSELVALLLENQEIKSLQPEINKASRAKTYPYYIYSYTDELGYLNLNLSKHNAKNVRLNPPLSYHTSKLSAKGHLEALAHQFQLCDKLQHIDEREGACISYQMQTCFGACVLEEPPDAYNERAQMAINAINQLFDQDFIFFVEGRHSDELAAILIQDGRYIGFGFVVQETIDQGVEEILEAIGYQPINPEANGIVRSFLRDHKGCKKILL